MTRRRVALLLCLVALGTECGFSAIQYDNEGKRLWVTDFPEAYPCTMDKVLAVDRMCGWNVVDHDPATDTYTVQAHLTIGANDGSDTFFLLGSSRHPRSTLILYGNLVVHPSWIREQNEGQPRRVNRLTIGSATDTNVSVTIKIGDTQEGNRHSFYVGAIPHGKSASRHWSGQLHMYNSAIQPLVPDKAHALGATGGPGNLYLAGDSIHLFSSRLSWVKGVLAADLVMHLDTIVRDCVFEHGRIALNNYKETEHKKNLIRGCTFRDCGIAVNSHELVMVLTDCVFEDNDRNWVLDDCRYLRLDDCQLGPPRKGDIYTRNARAQKNGWHPELISRRHVIVEVVDPQGQPVKGSVVRITCRQSSSDLVAVTGETGRTPETAALGAVLLHDLAVRATDKPEQQERTEYVYDLVAGADGFKDGRVTGYRPTNSWDVVRVELSP